MTTILKWVRPRPRLDFEAELVVAPRDAPVYREIFLLHALEGREYTEVSRRLFLSGA